MKVQIEEISPIKQKLNFEIPEQDYQKALDKAYTKLQKKVDLKGFRKGKVPRTVLEKYYGERTAMETVSDLMDQAYKEAMMEHQIPAVAMPEITDLKNDPGAPITFSAEVEVQPSVTAEHFEGIKLTKTKIEISDEEIQKELEGVQKSQAQWVPEEAETASAEGHTVLMNYEGRLDGVPFEGGKGENMTAQLGAKQFLPDFEKGLLGLKKGEKNEFPVHFPEDYGAKELAGKTATFTAEILEIKKQDLPEIDDELAKDLGKFETLEELKADIKKHLTEHKEKQDRNNLFKQMLDHLIEKNSFEIPQAMVDRELDQLWKNLKNQLAQQGATPEQAGIKEEEYRAQNREEASRRIKGFLLFDSVAKQNDLKVSEAEIDAELEKIATQHKQSLESIKKFYQERNLIASLYSQLLEDKIFDFLFSKAKVLEKEEKEEGWLKGKLDKLKGK